MPENSELRTVPVSLRKPVDAMDIREMLEELVTVARVIETAISQLSQHPMMAAFRQ